MRRYDPSRNPEGHLTDAGRALIAEMKRLGILIDVMHLVEPAFWEVLDTIAGPVIVSHGGARGMTRSIRYLSDKQTLAVARASTAARHRRRPSQTGRHEPRRHWH